VSAEFEGELDPTLCKAEVRVKYDDPKSPAVQCKRRPTKDGWCGLHHPDRSGWRRKGNLEQVSRSRLDDDRRQRYRLFLSVQDGLCESCAAKIKNWVEHGGVL